MKGDGAFLPDLKDGVSSAKNLMKKYIEPKFIYTGRMFEFEVFGDPVLKNNGEKKSLFEAILEVKRNQGSWDPTDPNTRFANDLHALICDRLKLENYSELKFYKALGGGLDWYYGADGFFELGDRRVFIDLTLRNKKLRDTVEIHPDDVLENIADTIAEQLS